ncbi:hypothetical protein [Modestobacter sp. NPDC049651]|uniref:hypothetical protein n=1 Tax=unclassified Modestobacter TaxID=2643866 RepID=UPI0033F14B40
MRKSRVLLAGAAVVTAAAAAGSAFTAGNDTSAVTNQVAGYGQVQVTGVKVTDIAYVPRTTDGTYLDGVDFTLDGNVTLDDAVNDATLTLKSNADDVVGSPFTCVIVSSSSITCDTTAQNVKFASFTHTGLTVVH